MGTAKEARAPPKIKTTTATITRTKSATTATKYCHGLSGLSVRNQSTMSWRCDLRKSALFVPSWICTNQWTMSYFVGRIWRAMLRQRAVQRKRCVFGWDLHL